MTYRILLCYFHFSKSIERARKCWEVVLANVFAWPIAYYFMRRWLEGFAYHTSLNILAFFASGALAMIIALLTVSFQTVKAATANPVDSLRYEWNKIPWFSTEIFLPGEDLFPSVLFFLRIHLWLAHILALLRQRPTRERSGLPSSQGSWKCFEAWHISGGHCSFLFGNGSRQDGILPPAHHRLPRERKTVPNSSLPGWNT